MDGCLPRVYQSNSTGLMIIDSEVERSRVVRCIVQCKLLGNHYATRRSVGRLFCYQHLEVLDPAVALASVRRIRRNLSAPHVESARDRWKVSRTEIKTEVDRPVGSRFRVSSVRRRNSQDGRIPSKAASGRYSIRRSLRRAG